MHQLLLARVVERHREDARLVANVDAVASRSSAASDGYRARLARPELQQRPRPFRLHLRSQDAGRRAGRLGAGDAALDDGHADPALGEAQRHRRAHDAAADDGDVVVVR